MVWVGQVNGKYVTTSLIQTLRELRDTCVDKSRDMSCDLVKHGHVTGEDHVSCESCLELCNEEGGVLY